MPLEPNLATVVVLLVAVVVATMGGGLFGRRFRTWHERRTARRALAAMAARTAALQTVPTDPDVPPPTDAVTTAAGRSAGASVAGQSYLARRLAGAPPPVVARRPSSLSPALAARGGRPITDRPSLAMPAPVRPGRRRRRLVVASALIVCLFAVGITLGVVATSRQPRGEVLDAAGTPGPDAGGPGDGAAALPVAPDGTQTDPGSIGAEEPTPGEDATKASTPTATATDRATPTDAPTDVPTPRPTSPRTPGTADPTRADPTDPTRDPATPDPTPRPTPKPTPKPTPDPTSEPTPPPTPEPTPEPTPPAGQAPRVDFDFSVNGLKVAFNNHTKGADHWTWDFGDGDTSTARKPSHTYAGSGTYTVTLTAWSTGGEVASETQDVTVSDN